VTGVSIVIGTPGRYARNGKRHKKQSASKKAAVVCATQEATAAKESKFHMGANLPT